MRGQMPEEWDVTYTYPNGTVEIKHITRPPPGEANSRIIQNSDGTKSMKMRDGAIVPYPLVISGFVHNSDGSTLAIMADGSTTNLSPPGSPKKFINNHDGTSTAVFEDGHTETYPTPGLP
jgi:hypothetical protein